MLPFLQTNTIQVVNKKEVSKDYSKIPTEKTRLIPSKSLDDDILPDNAPRGLFNIRAITFLILWYFFSFCTLFLNKYILTYLRGDATLLGFFQMLMTTTCGFIQLWIPCGMYKRVKRSGLPPKFFGSMLFVGCTRFSTVLLGLVALKYVAVSFTETVKSSAPIFTVVISWLILDERTGILTNLSLVPVMGGLALCSAHELSFNYYGFMASMATNITECIQNVLSKYLISDEKYKYTPAELQFYTSVASVAVQVPTVWLMIDYNTVVKSIEKTLLTAFLLNGLFFHFQSITAYVLMSYISPVTHSVANTTKRALLIWLSVITFGNPVTLLSGLGTCIVLVGVLLYNKAKELDAKRKKGTERVIILQPKQVSS